METERLLLRPITPDDLDTWAKCIFADPDVTRFLVQRDISPRERAERALKAFDANWSQYGFGEWAVIDKLQGLFIGHCGLAFVPKAGEVEVDYALAKAAWGRGLATEAARASIRFGFEQTEISRLIGLVVPENIASRRVLEHNGFVHTQDVHYWGLDLMYHTLERDQFTRIFPPDSRH